MLCALGVLGGQSAVSGFPDVRAEMAHYLHNLSVDGVITDNPDQMPPRRRP